jgi:hypothetical protein
LSVILGQLTPCWAGQKESIPKLDLKWVIPPQPLVEYPFHARNTGFTGSGIYVLDIEPRNGNVVRTCNARSGSAKDLDDAALKAFKKSGSNRDALRTFRFQLPGPLGDGDSPD